MTKKTKFYTIPRGRLGGIWADECWHISNKGLNIGGSSTDGGIPFFPEQAAALQKDMAAVEAHLEQQLQHIREARSMLPKIKILPEDIAATLRGKQSLSEEQCDRLKKLRM
jgi:hypothetical protein